MICLEAEPTEDKKESSTLLNPSESNTITPPTPPPTKKDPPNNTTNIPHTRPRRATITFTHSPHKLVLPTTMSLSSLAATTPAPSLIPESNKGKERVVQLNEIQREISQLDDRHQLDEEEKKLERLENENPDSQDELFSIYPPVYFNIPIVKFWTNSMFYVAFLIIQAYLSFLILLFEI
jgi:hypothetical protein